MQQLKLSSNHYMFLFLGVYFICMAWGTFSRPLNVWGDFFGDSFAYESATHFAEDGFREHAFLMNRNYGQSHAYYTNHGGAFTYIYALFLALGVESIYSMRLIALTYFGIFLCGFYYYLAALGFDKKTCLLCVIISCLNPLVITFSSCLEGAAYLTPFIFWIGGFFYRQCSSSHIIADSKVVYPLLFLLTFIDARFSHMAVVYGMPLLVATSLLYFKRENVSKIIYGLAACLAGYFASTSLYHFQVLQVSSVGFLAQFQAAVAFERSLAVVNEFLKIPYYVFFVPSHAMLLSVAVGYIFCRRAILFKKKSTKFLFKAVGVMVLSFSCFPMILPGKYFQHVQFYLPALIFALSPLPAFVVQQCLSCKSKDFLERVVVCLLIGSLFLGIFFSLFERHVGSEIDFEVFSRYERYLPEDANVFVNYSLPVVYYYLRRHIINHNDSIDDVAYFKKLLKNMRSEAKPTYFLCIINEDFKNPRKALVRKMLLKGISVLPREFHEKLESRVMERLTVSISEDMQLYRYLESTYEKVFNDSSIGGALFQIQ